MNPPRCGGYGGRYMVGMVSVGPWSDAPSVRRGRPRWTYGMDEPLSHESMGVPQGDVLGPPWYFMVIHVFHLLFCISTVGRGPRDMEKEEDSATAEEAAV